MNNKGIIFSAYIYVLLVFFLLSLASLLLVLNNTKRLSDKIKEGTSGIVNQDNSNFSIDIVGDSTVYMVLGDTYSDPGFSASDKDGNPLEVVISSDLDIWKAGTYTIKYYTKYNNLDKIVTRKVVVMKNRIGEKVYGVAWNGTGSTLTRTDDSIDFTYQINESTIDSDFDNAEIYKDIEEVTDTYGNIFVKIPKFYIKKTTDGTNWTWQISLVKKDANYYLPSCFYDFTNSVELPYVLVGKYDASLSTDGTKLESKTGKTPLVSRTIDAFRTLARANNTGGLNGYQLLDIHVVDVLQILFYVEYATLDSQSVMSGFTLGAYDATHTITGISGTTLTLATGKATNYRVGQMIDIGTSLGGREIAENLKITAISGDNIKYENVLGISNIKNTIAVNQIVYNIGYLTGTTNVVSTVSGSPTSNIDGKYSMKYREIENLYGNIHQFVDGLNIKDNQGYVAKDPNQYASDVFTGAYTKVEYVNANTNNFVSKVGYDSNNPFIQLPIEVGANNTTYKDYYYQSIGNRIALFGGLWRNGSIAGVSRWDLDEASSRTGSSVSSRLVKKSL